MIVTVNLAVTLKMDSDDNDFEDTFVPQTTENKNSRHQKFLEVFIYIYVLGTSTSREYKHNIYGDYYGFKIENL